MVETDVLIVGGGPAGAIAGKHLSQAGVKNILIQRNFGFKKPCGGGIRIDAFDEFELDKNIIEKYVDTIALVYKEQKIEVDISETPLGIVDRVKFDSYLRDRAVISGSELYEASFVSLESFDSYVISTIKKGDEYIKVKSQYLIGADGVNSKVRKLVNGDSVNSSMTNYMDLTSIDYGICEFHFGEEVADKYYAWAFPHAGGTNIGSLADDNQSCVKQLLMNLGVQEQGKIFGYKIPHFKDNIFYKDRVFFVGDSASQVLPFTYEGIYYAMASAKLLAGVIVSKSEPSAYEKRWNEKYYVKFSTLRKLQEIFLHNNFMISIMMRLYQSKRVQREMVRYWLGKREVKINIRFFLHILKYIFKK